MTFSERYDDAVGDVNAAIAKLDALLFDIQEDEGRLDEGRTLTVEDGEIIINSDRSDSLEEVIDSLNIAVDFDHLSLDPKN